MKKIGKIPSEYPEFEKNTQLAELIGVILGDGHISQFPRTQRLEISSNAKNIGFIQRYSKLTDVVFRKKPSIISSKKVNVAKISIYQNHISERLNIPPGDKRNLNHTIPNWIRVNKDNLLAFLRGLYEAEGSLSIHPATYTYNFQFSNYNPTLLDCVEGSLVKLGFHPERRDKSVRLRKKKEVETFRSLIKFRIY